MRTYQKLFVSLALAGCVTLVTPLSGFAQSAFEQCAGMGGKHSGKQGRNPEQAQARMAQHQQQLHDALGLSAEQEQAWKRFTASTSSQEAPNPLKPADLEQLSAPERADKMLEQLEAHQVRMKKHSEALKTFYATLNPEQKKIFDQQQRPQVGKQSGPRKGMPDGSGNRPAMPPEQR